MSDDEDELRSLRAQRQARLGGPTVAPPADRSAFFLPDARSRPPAGLDRTRLGPGTRAASVGGGRTSPTFADGEEDEDAPTFVEAPDGGDEAMLQAMLPTGFGKRPAGPPWRQPQRAPAPAAAAAAGRGEQESGRGSGSGGGSGGGSGELRGPAERSDEEVAEEDDEPMVGPPRPPSLVKRRGRSGSRDSDDEGDDDEDDEDEDDGDDGGGGGIDVDPYRVPVTSEIVLRGPQRLVSALAVDPSGTRVVVGSHDYTVRMYDFPGMDSRLRSFRQMEPFEAHPITALSFSPTGERLLAASGSAKLKVMDRDGLTLGESVRGDMYIRDARHTKGHLSGITGGQWHPEEKATFLTCSDDGTLRVWDADNLKQQKQVVKPFLARPARVPVSSCAYSPDGSLLAGGLKSGSVQVWSARAAATGGRPEHVADAAHDGEEVTGVAFASDGRTLGTRGMDGSLKVWDLRSFKAPTAAVEGLCNLFSGTGVAFSPDGLLAATGTSVEPPRGAGRGKEVPAAEAGGGSGLVFVDRSSGEVVRRTALAAGEGSVVPLVWHKRLNQILAGAGDKKGGGTHVFFDVEVSEKGALYCAGRNPAKRAARSDDFVAAIAPVIHNPHALPLFRDPGNRKRKREKIRQDPIASKRPELPVTGQGKGGRLGASQKNLLTQHMMKQGMLARPNLMDPREAILRHAESAAKNPIFTKAYANTQPVPIFAEPSDDEEDDAAGK